MAIKQFKWKTGECTAVENRVFTSTNCVPNPTVKNHTSYIKLGLLKDPISNYVLYKKNRDRVCP